MSNISQGEQLSSAEVSAVNSLAALAVTPAGSAITKTSPTTFANTPISGGSGLAFLTLVSGTINGINTSFTWSAAPKIIFKDNTPIQKQNSAPDNTTNWTGTTTTVFTQAPNTDLFALG